VNISGKTSSNI